MYVGFAPKKYGVNYQRRGYVYAHDTEEKMARMQCLPDSLVGRRYYEPTTQGAEAKVKERLEEILAWKNAEK